ncbi:DUF1203 domain-containing protein [Luteipulveratus halotolerans]|uniref:DUF1203 domain-containing protein n=1 Tax=Luteipulveratus halotolerans TaxID=1631356 RepID=A0A0L6CIH1_9MICO|nr:DUF1203 domain-containing protein [Luteipulveratus halotolerans]KNX37514.1 hypothetical protein VV01_10700 [Luteipulveratus halotolerans]
MTTTQAHAIDPIRLKQIWRDRTDERGNPLQAYDSDETFPLRCCLRQSRTGEEIALISYAPLAGRSPWAERGPVFIHLRPCDGYADEGLPADHRHGARVLRSYRHDGTMDYDGIVVTEPGDDLEPVLADLLTDPRRHEVHVRSVTAQCFTYRVTRSGEEPLA